MAAEFLIELLQAALNEFSEFWRYSLVNNESEFLFSLRDPDKSRAVFGDPRRGSGPGNLGF